MRGNFAERENNESETVEKSVVWAPSLDDEKMDVASKRCASENWIRSGRQEFTYTDLLSGLGTNADLSNGFSSPFIDQSPTSAIPIRKMAMDHARPWSMMPSGLSLRLGESNNANAPVQGGDLTYQGRSNIRYNGYDYSLLQGHRTEHSHGNWLIPPLPPTHYENPGRELTPKPILVEDQETGRSKDGNCKLFGISLFSNPVTPDAAASQKSTMNGTVGNQFCAFESDPKSEQSKSSKLPDDNLTSNEKDKPVQSCQPNSKDTRMKLQGGSTRSCTKVFSLSFSHTYKLKNPNPSNASFLAVGC